MDENLHYSIFKAIKLKLLISIHAAFLKNFIY
jgi:hypothetical protein